MGFDRSRAGRTAAASDPGISSPNDIENLTVWLDASDESSLTIPDRVTHWAQQGERTPTAVNVGATAPVWSTSPVNGVFFDAQDLMTFNSPEIDATGGFTIVFVMTPTSPIADADHYYWGSASLALVQTDDADASSLAGFSDSGGMKTIASLNIQRQVTTWRFSGTTGELFKNGSLLGSDTWDGTSHLGTTGRLGNKSDSTTLGGVFRVHEILGYDRAITDEEHADLVAFLTTKWSIT